MIIYITETIVCLRNWYKNVFTALETTILVRHPTTGKFLVNINPQIPEIVRETKCMIKLGLEVPEQAKNILTMENKLKSNKLRLEVNLKIIMIALFSKKKKKIWLTVNFPLWLNKY